MSSRNKARLSYLPENYTTVQLRTDYELIRNLHLEADRLYNGKVELLSDQLVRRYMEEHRGQRRLTTYLGYSCTLVYNLRVQLETKEALREFCGSFTNRVGMSEVVKAALYQWELQLRDRFGKT